MSNNQLSFYFNDIPKPYFFKVKNFQKWIATSLKEYSVESASIDYVFSHDDYVLSINKQFLDHDDYTDIITFDNTIHENHLVGEIYISIDRVKENSKKFNATYRDELLRVMAHGVLHLLGFKDKNPADQKLMRSHEDRWILHYGSELN